MVILVGVVLFVVAVRQPNQPAYLVVSIVALVIGSAFLFRGEVWYIPAVNPILASVVSVASGGFFWIVARKVIEARNVQPTHDLKALVGAVGEARSEVHTEGSVQVAGELWSAYSDTLIPDGARVRVVGREGFMLKVEPISKESA